MIITGQFSDFFNETMLPALNTVPWNRYKKYAKQYPSLINVLTSSKSIEQFSQVSGLGLFVEIDANGGNVSYDQPLQGFDKTYKPSRFGLGFKVSADTIEDDKISLVKKMSVELGRSCYETQELDASSLYNNAFSPSYLGPDGKSLCAADHPLIKSGGTQSNILAVAADLDQTSLEIALADFELQRDSSGKFVHVPAKKLAFGRSNRFNAYELLKSPMRSDTANNTINALRYAQDGLPDPFFYRYLLDPDAWFLVASPEDTGVKWFWRKKPYSDSEKDFDSETMKYVMRYRRSLGWDDFYGIYGTPGAA